MYEPVASGPDETDHEHNFSYIKCIDHGKQVIMSKIDGYLPGRIAQFISNCCHCHWTIDKKLYISRHGQSEYNEAGRIGGDSDLTAMGERYALALAQFADEVRPQRAPANLQREPCRLEGGVPSGTAKRRGAASGAMAVLAPVPTPPPPPPRCCRSAVPHIAPLSPLLGSCASRAGHSLAVGRWGGGAVGRPVQISIAGSTPNPTQLSVGPLSHR